MPPPSLHIDTLPEIQLPGIEPIRPPMTTFSAQRFSPRTPPCKLVLLPEAEYNDPEVLSSPSDLKRPSLLSLRLTRASERVIAPYTRAQKVRSACKRFATCIRGAPRHLKEGAVKTWTRVRSRLKYVWARTKHSVGTLARNARNAFAPLFIRADGVH